MTTTQGVYVSETDCYLFGQGTHYDIYRKLGAHPTRKGGKQGVFFAVWAPHAASVSVVGEWNDWQPDEAPMEKIHEMGIWTAFLSDAEEGMLYKFAIRTPDGRLLFKADPFANAAELRPGTASRITRLTGYRWKDADWMEARDKKNCFREPIAIYECHVGSWMRHPVGNERGEEGFYSYREFANRLVKYLQETPYTHVELMGILEHPFDGSWGYQVTGYYAPTARYGSPKDFMYLVDTLHRHGIGVILDWVPAHFCPDEHGLARFDGECLFEDPDPRRGEHPDWGTRIFNLARTEVRNFLIANVLFWIREYHVDGIRVDAVASMLYLDYGKKDGEWLPNRYGGNENLDAIEFFRHLNSVVRSAYPGCLTIAEESTAWPKVTASAEDGGLGFTFKWNMGWMHDFCEYMKLDPVLRKGDHYALTFAMSYNASEKYILPLSHDEVVHLKCSMLEKMPGYEVDKFANLRLGYTYMFGHAGKKLLFMGQEFGQRREWSEERELDWFLLQEPLHAGMLAYTQDLLKLYRSHPCLYERDDSWEGFEWINADDADRSVYSFFRRDAAGKKGLLFVLNMTPVERAHFAVGAPVGGRYRLLLNSDDARYGGNGAYRGKKILETTKEECDRRPFRLSFDLPAYGGMVFSFAFH